MGASGPGKRYETTRKFYSSRSANHSHHLADSFPDPWGRAPRGRLFGWFVGELLLSVGGAVLLRRVVIVMLLPGTPGLDLPYGVERSGQEATEHRLKDSSFPRSYSSSFPESYSLG